MSLRLITGPVGYPVTLDEAKAQCRQDTASMGTDEDAILNAYIAAATAYVERYTGRALMTQTWELVLDTLSDAIMIPKGPVQSVTSIKYYDAASVLQTLDPTLYAADLVSDPAWIVRVSSATYPVVAIGVNNVIIRYVAGFETVPDDIRAAMLMLIAQWYDDRASVPTARPVADPEGGMLTLPNTVKDLLCNHRAY